MKNRKLLVVAPYYPPKRGGLENYAHEVSRGMAGHGWQVSVVTSNHETNERDVVRQGSVTVHRLARWAKVSNTPVNPTWPRSLRKIIADDKPDVINVHTPVPVMSDMAVRLAGNTPTVVTYHGDVAKDHPLMRVAWWFFGVTVLEATLRKATRIIATSDLYAAKSRYLRSHRHKIAIIPPGVDIRRFHPGVSAGDLAARYRARDVILFVGQLDRSHGHKGIGDLLQAVAYVRETHPRILCLIVGAGDALSGYRRQASRLGVDGNVEFHGSVSDEELPRYYRLSRAAVLPSTGDTEGFGMVLLEANATGTPSIGTDVGGIPHAIEHRRTGLLVPPRDPAALADAIRLVISDADLARNLGENGRERTVREFSWDLQVERHRRLFESLCR